jgi:hypothetical protein
METAKKVTFHERILKKSVTLDGDVLDPSGMLSGGTYSVTVFRVCFFVPWCGVHVPFWSVHLISASTDTHCLKDAR